MFEREQRPGESPDIHQWRLGFNAASMDVFTHVLPVNIILTKFYGLEAKDYRREWLDQRHKLWQRDTSGSIASTWAFKLGYSGGFLLASVFTSYTYALLTAIAYSSIKTLFK